MDFNTEYLAFIAAARARNKKIGLTLKKSKSRTFKANGFDRGSYQTHHVIPRSCGGSNTYNNVVALTPDEHVVAHFLYNVSVQQWKGKKNLKRDHYCFGVPELKSILKFIPNVLSSFVVKYDFKCSGLPDSVTGTISDIAKFVCVTEDVSASDPMNYMCMAARVLNACFRRHHKLNSSYHGTVKLADLNFAA